MDEDSQGLFECVKLFEPNFSKFVLDHFVYFATIKLGWSEEKVLSQVKTLISYNKIMIENNIINVN